MTSQHEGGRASVDPGSAAFDGRRPSTIAVLVGLVVLLGVANVARSAWVPSGAHLTLNLGLAVVTLGIGRAMGLGLADLGLAREDLGRGLRTGLLAAAAITVVVVGAALVPAADSAFTDDRVDVTFGAMAWRVLVIIPVGTVVVEELIFRGVLHGLLRRLATDGLALGIGAVLFGLWHVYPAWGSSADNEALAGVGRAGVVLGTFASTTIAGLGFGWLRVRSHSTVAPMLAHVATNSVPFAVAWAVAR